MNPFIECQVSLLASGKQIKTAVSELLDAVHDNRQHGSADNQFAEGLAARLQASPAALGHLVSLLDNSEDARDLLNVLLPPPATDCPQRENFRRTFVASQHSAAAIKAYTSVLHSTDIPASISACYTLAALTARNKENGRAAAAAGAIRKLVRLLESNDPEEDANGFHRPLKVSASFAMGKIVEGSCNRARQASKAGAMKALCNVISPPYNSMAVVDIGIAALLTILEGLDAITEDRAVLQLCFERLAGVLVHSNISLNLKHTTVWLLGRYIGIDNSLSRMITPVLIQAGAGPTLVQLSADKLELEQPCAMGMLTCMLQRSLSSAAAALAAEIVEAGVIDVAKRILREAPTSGNIAIIAREQARSLLQSLLAIDMFTYSGLIGMDGMGAILAERGEFSKMADELEAAQAASQTACAACGKSEGSGKGGALQQCSACKKVVYCSRECQKGHWKVHKRKCKA